LNAAESPVVSDLARQVVAQAAPQELPLFRATSEAYFENPGLMIEQRQADDMLGFGPAAAVAFLTPLILRIATDVVEFLFTQVSNAFQAEASEAIAGRVHKLLHGSEGSGGDDTPALTREQLTHVRELALAKARELKLPEDEASLLADSVVGGLATS
jgi:hypothetical protein